MRCVPGPPFPFFYSVGARLPFDVADLRALSYKLDSSGTPSDIPSDKAALVERLRTSMKAQEDKPITDSPLFQLVEGYPEVSSDKTDVFQDQVRYSAEIKARLEKARKQGVEAIRAIEKELGNVKVQESGVVVDLFLSYRSVKAWDDMLALVDKMSRPLASTALMQEQLALALNRAGQGEKAERVLKKLIEHRGPSSETYGILGRVYKDRCEAALKANKRALARSLIEKAIEAYLSGFGSLRLIVYNYITTLRSHKDTKTLKFKRFSSCLSGLKNRRKLNEQKNPRRQGKSEGCGCAGCACFYG